MAENPTFVRQRRGLFLSSFALILVSLFKVEGTMLRLGPSTGAGITLDLYSGFSLYLILFLLWAWSCYRYWIYFLKEKQVHKNVLAVSKNEAFTHCCSDHLKRIAEQELHARYAAEQPGLVIESLTATLRGGVQDNPGTRTFSAGTTWVAKV